MKRYFIVILLLLLLIIACNQATGAVSETGIQGCKVEVKTYIKPLPYSLQDNLIAVDMRKEFIWEDEETCTIDELGCFF